MNPTIKHSTFINASPQSVYDAVTTSDGLNAWFTTSSEVVASEGGMIIFRWKDYGMDKVTIEDGGPVLAADPPRRFVFQWHPISANKPTTVEMTFSEFGPGTRVDLVESGYGEAPDDLKACLNCAVGWGEALTLLKYYLEQKDRYMHPCMWSKLQ